MLIEINENALQELTEIQHYITYNLNNPIAGINVVRRIMGGINSLIEYHNHPKIDKEFEIRKMLVKKYYVFYTVHQDKQIIEILHIIYSRRDWLNLI
jgi:plasmid stabilization system protein ParE